MKKIYFLSIFCLFAFTGTIAQNVGVGTDTPGARLEIQGETNTAATNALDVNTADGTLILRVRNDQRVGIGTTTLTESLNVGGNIRFVGANRSIGTYSNDDFHLTSSSQIRMTVKNTGRIGIGTDNPTTLLDVYADDASQSFIQARSNVGRLRFHVGPFRNYIQSSEAGSADFRDLYFGSVGGANNHMVIKGGSGNVGIGLTNPQSTLDINGEIRIRGGNPAAGRVLTSDANGNAVWEDIGALIDEVDPSWDGDADITGVIGRDGRVGVGTTSPSATAQFHSVLTTAGSNQQRAGYFRINWDGSSAQATALHGNAVKSSSETSGRSTGVYGQAGNATNRWNTGVSAVLQGSNDGAAVLAGTTQGFLDHGFSGSFQHQYVSPAGQWGIVSYSDVYFHEDHYVMGDVGIGTAEPIASLHVKSNVWRDHIVIDRTQNASIDRVFGITQTTTQGGRAQFYFADPDNGTPHNYALQVQEETSGSGARVGIGKGAFDTFSEALDVNGNITLSSGANGTVFARNLRTHDGSSLYIEDASGNRGLRLNSTGVSIYERLAVGTADPTNAPNNGLYVNGNTGLGNTNPQGKLHISLNNSANEPVIVDKANGTGNGPIMEWYGFGETHRLQLTYTDSPFRYEFNTDQSSRNIAFAPNMNLSLFLAAGNQNVGIKTENPTADLDIDGEIRIRGGNPQAGRVLTSDANGLATWEVAPSGGGSGGDIWTLRLDNNIGSTTVPITVTTWTSVPLGYSPTNTDRYMIEFSNNTSNGLEKGISIVGHGNFTTTNGMSVVSYQAYDGQSGGVLNVATYAMQWRISGSNIEFRFPTKITQDGTSSATPLYVKRIWSAPKE
ncbi:MAG: hypothetical protein EA412_13855 [Chitinophagaceae bacterium]|nr:MAG: hypothetical protein EA412_13855 [Chitinophagaceae bacterium]